MHREQGCVAELSIDHAPQVSVDLADAVVIACSRNTVATRGGWLIANEVVTLVNGEDEQRILARDPVCRETIEELLECQVVILQLLNVTSLAGTICEVDVTGSAVAIVCI